MSAWEWLRESWKWVSSGFGRLRLPSSVFESSSPRRIMHAIVVPGKRIYWTEVVIEDAEAAKSMKNHPRAQSHALLSSDYALLTEKTGSLTLDVSAPNLISAWSQALLGVWLAPNNGLWMHLSSSPTKPSLQLGFYSTITNRFTPFEVADNVTRFAHHPNTLELVLFDQEARITLVQPRKKKRVNQIPLSQLKIDPTIAINSIQLHQHSMLIVASDGWYLLDVRSGVLVSSYKWPNPALNLQPWATLSEKDTSPGFWGNSGLWRLKSLPVAQYTSIVAAASNDTSQPIQHRHDTFADSIKEIDEFTKLNSVLSPQMAASLIAKDWSLVRLEAKYLLDLLMAYTALDHPTMRDTAVFIAACDRLVPHLQSPIILLSILEEAHMSSLACDITRQFINTYMARHTSGISVVSQNEVDLRAFQLFTSFNADTIGLLIKYVDHATEASLDLPLTTGNEDKKATDDLLRQKLTSISPSEFGKMDLSDFYLYLNRCSDMLLLKLIEYSGIGVSCLDGSSRHFLDASFLTVCEIAFLPPSELYPPKHAVNTALLREEERPTHPDMFSAMCLLLFRYEPQWLLPFVDVLMREEMLQDGRSLLPRRALASLPPFEAEPLPAHSSSSPSPTPSSPRSPLTPRLVSTKRASTDRIHQLPKEEQQRELRLLARIGLYERARRHSSAVTTLLQLYKKTHSERYWRMVLYSIDSKSPDFPGRRSPGSSKQPSRENLLVAANANQRSRENLLVAANANQRSRENLLVAANANQRSRDNLLTSANASHSNAPGSPSPSLTPKDIQHAQLAAQAKQSAYLLKTRTELITTVLVYCLDPQHHLAKARYFDDLFTRASSKLTPMDLTTSLRQEFARMQSRQSPPQVLVTDETAQMSVSTLRTHLLKLGVK